MDARDGWREEKGGQMKCREVIDLEKKGKRVFGCSVFYSSDPLFFTRAEMFQSRKNNTLFQNVFDFLMTF